MFKVESQNLGEWKMLLKSLRLSGKGTRGPEKWGVLSKIIEKSELENKPLTSNPELD